MTHTPKINPLSEVPIPSAHNATLRHAPGLVAIFLFGAALIVAAPLIGKDYVGATVSVAAILVIKWRFTNMRLVFSDDALIYQGWFKQHHLPYVKIIRVLRPHSEGWPKDRMYGSAVYEIVAQNSRTKIDLLWFGPSGWRVFKDRILDPIKQLRTTKRRK